MLYLLILCVNAGRCHDIMTFFALCGCGIIWEKDVEKNSPIPVVIYVYKDKSFSFETKLPPVSYLIKKACNLKSGAKNPNKDPAVAKIKMSQVKQIAEFKMPDLNCTELNSAMNIVKGQCKSMGIEVVEG